MAKRPDLRQALKPRNETSPAQPVTQQDNASPAKPKDPHFRPSREGKSNVTGYFHPAVKKQLRILAADRDTTIQDLLAEALNDLFAKHGKPEIAPMDGAATE
ncbi:MAG: ribbon-helix-helix domain-containing protein [Candidatus Acidiferrales bacterium]|jgi:hypothetical protein